MRFSFTVGNEIPISQVRDDVAHAFRKEIEWQSLQENVYSKKDDVVTAISLEISRCKINKLVIGASSCRIFSRAAGRPKSLRSSASNRAAEFNRNGICSGSYVAEQRELDRKWVNF
ncbi:unnamed protein product [Fraxinus pennsylvanica]|uniref:Uncharacterized protein n=1 Tax=Fraxinus pennsylvanica TaxID=56036 RepID=A0AAD2EC10_9LAMI|nr:unnamed protein product [Fraxinus pennsylvanica]